MKNLTRYLLLSRIWVKFTVLFLAFFATVFGLLSPYYQKLFVDSLVQNPTSTLSFENHIYTIFHIFIYSILSQFLLLGNKLICYIEATNYQKELSENIYKKALNLTSKSSSKVTLGQMISIYATDNLSATNLIDDILPNIISYSLPIILGPIAVHLFCHIEILPIYLIIFTILAFNSVMGLRQGRFFATYKKLAANRVGIVNEWLNNIRSIRILGWTTLFENKIIEAREKETKNRLTMVTNGSTLNSISYSAPYFINLIAVYFLLKISHKEMTPGGIFSLIWIFGVVLTRPMRMLPMLFVTISDCLSSIHRVEDFFQLESENDFEVNKNIQKLQNKKDSEYALEIKNLNVKFDEKELLKNISLQIKKGEFIAIIGEVGSGKSVFFQTLLGFLECQAEKFKIFGLSISEISLSERRQFFSFVPQDLFIMNASLRDNATLTYATAPSYDTKILQSLNLSQFELQNEKIDFGLGTEIGEKGVNLSGGQKQRVSLARAHNHDAEIILLDDCLSALDVNTEDKINESLLKGAWKDKTRILVTHRLSILPHCDRVFEMKQGTLSEIR